MSDKMAVRKIGPWWTASCPLCPLSRGWQQRPTFQLACLWVGSHIKAHQEKRLNVEWYKR